MSGPTRTQWRLFIDESGDFADAKDTVVVAGLLLRRDAPGTHPAALRDALAYAVPDVPWPLHANRLRFPVLFALAAVARRHVDITSPHLARVPPGQNLADLAERVVALLRLRCAADVEVALAALSDDETPDWSVLRRLNAELRQADAVLYRQLAAKMRSVDAALREIFDRLQSGKGQGGLPPAWISAAGEYVDGDASPHVPPQSDLGTQRYLSLLRICVDRVRDLLLHAGGHHEVGIQVLSRPFSLRSAEQESMRRDHLADTVAASERDGEAERVQVKVERVPYFDAGVDPALVLADYLANCARHALRPLERSLSAAEDLLRVSVAANLRCGTPPLSSLAASGLSATLAPHPAGRRWALEQAREWAAVGGGAEGRNP